MEITIKQEFLIKVFCVIMLIGLCILVYINGKDLTCNNCIIKFKTLKRGLGSSSTKVYQNFSVNIFEIYDSFMINESDCLLVFDTNQGFHYKNATEYQ